MARGQRGKGARGQKGKDISRFTFHVSRFTFHVRIFLNFFR